MCHFIKIIHDSIKRSKITVSPQVRALTLIIFANIVKPTRESTIEILVEHVLTLVKLEHTCDASEKAWKQIVLITEMKDLKPIQDENEQAQLEIVFEDLKESGVNYNYNAKLTETMEQLEEETSACYPKLKSEELIYNKRYLAILERTESKITLVKLNAGNQDNLFFDNAGIFEKLISRWYRFLPTWSKCGYGPSLVHDKNPNNARVETFNDFIKWKLVNEFTRNPHAINLPHFIEKMDEFIPLRINILKSPRTCAAILFKKGKVFE